MRYSLVFLMAMLLTVGNLLSHTKGSPEPQYEVKPSNGTIASPPPPPNFNLESIPAGARLQLLPLYQQEYRLLQELSVVRWQALGDTLGGLASVAGPALTSTGAADVVRNSAANAGQYGATNKGVNAAADAQTPAEMYQSVDRAMKLLVRIGELDKQISTIQQAYGLDPNVKSPSPWVLFGSRTLTPAEVKKLLEPAAKDAAKAAGNPKASSSGSQSAHEQIRQCSAAWNACSAPCSVITNDSGKSGGEIIAEIHAQNRCLASCEATNNACLANIK
jgi:hypothetical protein